MIWVKYKTLLLIGFILLLPFNLIADEKSSHANLVEGDVFFFLDYAQFQHLDGQLYAEIYYQIPHNQLYYRKQDDGSYQAQFEISAAIYDDDQNQLGGDLWREEFSVVTFEQTKLKGRFYLGQKEISLSPYANTLIVMIDDLNSNHKSTIERKIETYHTNRLVAISDILFASKIESNIDNSSSFVRGHLQVIPNPTRIYGEFYSDTYVYYELYGLSMTESYTAACTIYDERHKDVYHKDLSINKTVIGQYGHFDLIGLPQGTYTLQIVIVDSLERQCASTSGDFFIRRSIFTQDYDITLAQLSYIASPEEHKWLKLLPPEKRVEGLLQFWKLRDPTPHTLNNEALNHYYQRLNYANEHFGFANKEGWQTDRGRIYIKYGEPDEMQTQPFEPGLGLGFDGLFTVHSYEIWEYYYIENQPGGKTFIFVDETGHGSYRLYSVTEEDR